MLRLKKLISIFLCLVLISTLSGCRVSIESLSENRTSDLPESSDIVSEVPQVPVSSEEVAPPFTVTLSFLGDMILGCQLDQTTAGSFNEYTNARPPEYFLDKVRHILAADDFTIANLEVVLTDNELAPTGKNYSPAFWFKAKSSNINILSSSSVEGVLLNNNHTLDYGQQGYNDTKQTVLNAGIKYGDDTDIMYFEKNGFRVAVLCIRLWFAGNTEQALPRLEQAKQNSDYQVVLFHGGTEKIHAPEQFKIDAAHKFIDNGADLVVGGHPHVLQPREIYNDTEIVYSVGNFCYGGSRKPENRTVIYQRTITVNPKDLTVMEQSSNMIPCYVYTGSVNNYQPAVIENPTIRQQVLDFMDGKRNSPL